MKFKIALSQQNVFGTKQKFHEAQMQLLKALLHRDEENKANSKTSMLKCVIPIILFTGRIFDCYYADGELVTPEIDFTRYLAHGLPHQRFPALIDVMTLNYSKIPKVH